MIRDMERVLAKERQLKGTKNVGVNSPQGTSAEIAVTLNSAELHRVNH